MNPEMFAPDKNESGWNNTEFGSFVNWFKGGLLNENELGDGRASVRTRSSPRGQLKSLLDEVSRSLPTEQTLDNVAPIVDTSIKSPSSRRKARVAIKSASSSQRDVTKSKSRERRGTVSSAHSKPSSESLSEPKKSGKHSRTLSTSGPPSVPVVSSPVASSPVVSSPVGELDSPDPGNQDSLCAIQEDSQTTQTGFRKLPRLNQLDSLDSPPRKKSSSRPDTARNSSSAAAKRRKSMGPQEVEDQIKTRRREPRRGVTVEASKTSPLNKTLSPSSSSESVNADVLVRKPDKERRNKVDKERNHVRRVKSDSTLSNRINAVDSSPRLRLEDLKLKQMEKSKDRDQEKTREQEQEQEQDQSQSQSPSHSQSHSQSQSPSHSQSQSQALTQALSQVAEGQEQEREDLVYKLESGRNTLVWAKFEAVMELLLNTDNAVDPQILSVLLYTYPLFSNSHKILDSLVKNMSDSRPETKERTNLILSKWLELQYNWEIEHDKTLFRSIEKVIKGKIALEDKTGADELKSGLYRAKSSMDVKGSRISEIKSRSRPMIKCNSDDLESSQSEPMSLQTDGLAFNVFTIHFPGSKKTFVTNDSNRHETLAQILPNLCLQRSLQMKDYIPQDLNGKEIPLTMTLEEVPGGEIKFCKQRVAEVQKVINIHIVGDAPNEEFLVPILRKENQEDDRKLCTFLEDYNNLTTDDYIVKYASGVSLPIDIYLAHVLEDLYIYKRKVEPTKPQKKLLMNVFSDNYKGLAPELWQRRKELLGDPNKRSILLTLKPDEIAQALTAIEHELFLCIHEPELIGTDWKKKDRHVRAPNVVSMINWFNRTTNWIKTQILLGINAKERGAMIDKLIQTAQFCRLLRNYNTVIEIVSSLCGSVIRRLKQSWAEVSAESLATWANLSNYFSPETNYMKLREAHLEMISDKSLSAALPYIGIILEDLLKLDEVPQFSEDGFYVNWSKMQKVPKSEGRHGRWIWRKGLGASSCNKWESHMGDHRGDKIVAASSIHSMGL
eukprot:TRINITY_DN1052_c0_g2_i2.p1 TRINITY_DN1052_c0_g2~~TRINITY_DN1052_c0_g2_i2.p1  ORF type:complete len:1008 (+),score=147.20 TRINITY_DN1052_c0_g2_i2:41-3064(+)